VTSHDVMRIGLLLLTGIGSGLVGYAAGLASLVSFPVLIALGLPPLVANVTNSVALTGVSLGSVASAQPELAGMRRRILTFGGLAVIGGIVGALLLIELPPGLFEQVVPWLIAFGSLTLLLRPWLRRLHAGRIDEHHPVATVIIGLIAVYCGYFGAGAGVLLVAGFGAVMNDSIARLSALRSAVLGLANTVAAVIFITTGTVAWSMAWPLAIGSVIGSALGPPLLRRLPETPVRYAVAAAGLVLAVKLFLDYST
jgi:uncharacterized membrane protein YfcA